VALTYLQLYEDRSFPDFFEHSVTEDHRYRRADLKCRPGSRSNAADWLAVHLAKLRFGGSDHLFQSWLQRTEGGPAHDDETHDALVAYIASESIGTPERPAPSAHLEGFLAEHIWYVVVTSLEFALGAPFRATTPSWSVTDPGGDGLAIYEPTNNRFSFRLWESKRHSGGQSVRSTVNGACRQIRDHAPSYLARYSKIGQRHPDNPAFASFCGRLVELWLRSDRAAGGGVSVCISDGTNAIGCFDRLSNYWSFSEADQHEGLLVTIEDYTAFSQTVREILWKGL